MVLGLAHVLVQCQDPRPWDSPIGWRKPILFGISTGVTLLSVGWVIRTFFPRPPWHERWMAWAAGIEVLLITLQTWRGVPSHFSSGPVVDRWVAYVIEGLLVVVTASLGAMTWKLFRPASHSGPSLLDLKRAAQWGMVLLLLGCGVGFVIAFRGHWVVVSGGNPYVISPSGVPKFPHGMPLHALQFLPLWVGLCRWLGWGTVATRSRSMHFAGVGVVLVTFYAVAQSSSGLSRMDPGLVGWFFLVLTFLTVCLSIVSLGSHGRAQSSVASHDFPSL